MRTTIDIPENIFRRVKATAAVEGKSLKAFVLEALNRELATRKSLQADPRRVQLPLVASERPGTLTITGDTVAEALAAEDVRALA